MEGSLDGLNTYAFEKYNRLVFRGTLLAVARTVSGRDYIADPSGYRHTKRELDVVGLFVAQGMFIFDPSVAFSSLTVFVDAFFSRILYNMAGKNNHIVESVKFASLIGLNTSGESMPGDRSTSYVTRADFDEDGFQHAERN